MSNELKMAIVQSIQQLLAAGWSQRRIARQLGIDRSAVKRHVDLLRNATTATSKPATAPTGSPGSKPATFDAVPGTAGSEPGVAGFEQCQAPTGMAPESNEPLSVGHRDTGESTGANVTTGPAETPGSPADRSACEAHRAAIQAKVDQGLSAIRIHRNLHDEWTHLLGYA